MSGVIKTTSDVLEPLGTVVEVNENVVSEIFDRPYEEGEFEEIPPKIFGLKEIFEPLTIPSLDNAIYELGVVNLCWPEIKEPVFETRTCFPKSYYTNSSKERLLLAYAENFRRQFFLYNRMRKPLLLQVPNECGLQKMVCTSIRPTKLCFETTTDWQGIAALVADYFDYEPLAKPMLHSLSMYLKTQWYGMYGCLVLPGCSGIAFLEYTLVSCIRLICDGTPCGYYLVSRVSGFPHEEVL